MFTNTRNLAVLLVLFCVAGAVTTVPAQMADSSFIAPDTPVLGNPDADVTIMVFSDFQCPACRLASQVLQNVVPKFGDKVGMYYVHFPLDMGYNSRMQRQLHAEAGRASVASMCAQAEGDFWGYYKSLFDNQAQLSETLMLDLAQQRGWDRNAFKNCLDDEGMQQRVRDDVVRGMSISVGQTPTVFINGERVAVWHSEALLDMLIQQKILETES